MILREKKDFSNHQRFQKNGLKKNFIPIPIVSVDQRVSWNDHGFVMSRHNVVLMIAIGLVTFSMS